MGNLRNNMEAITAAANEQLLAAVTGARLKKMLEMGKSKPWPDNWNSESGAKLGVIG